MAARQAEIAAVHDVLKARQPWRTRAWTEMFVFDQNDHLTAMKAALDDLFSEVA